MQNRFKPPTAAVTLTFFKNVLLECVRVTQSDLYIPVYPFITPPRGYCKCQKFGHTSDKCPNDIACVRCVGAHNSRLCRSSLVCCTNCQGSYTVGSSRCPVGYICGRLKYKNTGVLTDVLWPGPSRRVAQVLRFVLFPAPNKICQTHPHPLLPKDPDLPLS